MKIKKLAGKLGFNKKPRDRAILDREYQAEALLAGHKSRLIVENTKLIDRLQKEVEAHLDKMQALDIEFQAAPALPPAPVPAQVNPSIPEPEFSEEKSL